MLRPVVNLAVVTDRQDAVQLLMNAPDVVAAFKDVLKKVQGEKCPGMRIYKFDIN